MGSWHVANNPNRLVGRCVAKESGRQVVIIEPVCHKLDDRIVRVKSAPARPFDQRPNQRDDLLLVRLGPLPQFGGGNVG
jgi:hypothetical protein